MQLSLESFAACLMSLLLLDVCKRATPQLPNVLVASVTVTDRAEAWHDQLIDHRHLMYGKYLN